MAQSIKVSLMEDLLSTSNLLIFRYVYPLGNYQQILQLHEALASSTYSPNSMIYRRNPCSPILTILISSNSVLAKTPQPYTDDCIILGKVIPTCVEEMESSEHLWLGCIALLTHRHQLQLGQNFDELVCLQHAVLVL